MSANGAEADAARPESLLSRLTVAFNGGPATVHDAQIKSATLHLHQRWWNHRYMLFLSGFPIYACAYYFDRESLNMTDDELANWGLYLVTVQAILLVLAYSSAVSRAGTTCAGVRSLKMADCICLLPADAMASSALVPLVKPNPDDPAGWSFVHDYTTFRVTSVDPPAFRPTTYPGTSLALIAGHVAGAGLHPARGDLARLHAQCGDNTLDIPVPPLAALCAEHALLTTFLLPAVCAGLWALLGYWPHALAAFLALVACEGVEIYDRISALKRLRAARIEPSALLALRDGTWTTVQSDGLYPGDVVSVTPSTGDRTIPADLLLLTGAVVANEAGQTALPKKPVRPPIAPGEQLKLDGAHRASVLFAGTKATQCTPTPDAPAAPDGGALAVVVRTGFGTAHGADLRKQLRRAERRARYLEAHVLLIYVAFAAGRFAWLYGAGPTRRRAFACVLAVVSVHAFLECAVFVAHGALMLCLLPMLLATTAGGRLHGVHPAVLGVPLALTLLGTLPLVCWLPADAWGAAGGALVGSCLLVTFLTAALHPHVAEPREPPVADGAISGFKSAWEKMRSVA